MIEQQSVGERAFADVLSRAVQARGLSLDRIRARLEVAGVPVSNATLSYWQSGRSLPTRARSLRTLVELESILDLEQGSLIELIRSADGRTRHQLFPWQSVVPGETVAEQIIADLGIEVAGRISRVAIHDTVTIGENRAELTQLTRLVLRAERSGTQAWPVVVQQDTADELTPEVESVFGCRVCRMVMVPERQLAVAEMVLPRPLLRGELVVAEYLVTWAPTDAPSFRLARACPEQLREIALGVQFHAKALPASVVGYSRATLDPNTGDDTETTQVALDEGEAQIVRLDGSPGVYGLKWTWD